MAYAMDLTGRVALVTGASSGLGRAFAQTLAGAGASVILASRRMDRLKDLRAQIESHGGQAHVSELDVTQVHSIGPAIAQMEAALGPIDILINNSGVSSTQRLHEVGAEDFDFVFDTNVRGAFFVAQQVAQRMLMRSKSSEKGSFPGGRIVNIASVAGQKPVSQIGVYCMSKAAVIHMTKVMALEWGKHGINVNAICPGYIDTEINHQHWSTEQGQRLVQMLPRKRLGQASDLDALLVLLCSAQSDFLNGSIITADDGFSL